MSSPAQIRVRERLRAFAACFAAAALLGLCGVGCGDSSVVLEAASNFAAEISETAAAAGELGGSAVVAALNDVGASSEADSDASSAGFAASPQRENAGGGSRTYYQFIDDTGSVRFVSSLEEVPEQWRDRAGSVELSSPPPARPADREAEFQARRERARAVLASTGSARSRHSSSDVEVQLYYATWCGYCRKAKAHLDDRGVDYVLLDVDIPSIKEQLLALTGSGSIPVLDVGGELVRGYNASEIDRLISKL